MLRHLSILVDNARTLKSLVDVLSVSQEIITVLIETPSHSSEKQVYPRVAYRMMVMRYAITNAQYMMQISEFWKIFSKIGLKESCDKVLLDYGFRFYQQLPNSIFEKSKRVIK